MSFWQTLEGIFSNRESKSDTENGEYYLNELLSEWQKVNPDDTNMNAFRLEALLNKNSGSSNSVENLGFYARQVNFDSEIISKAFENAIRNKGSNISLAEINFQLTGQSVPSQTADKIEQALNNGLNKSGEILTGAVDYVGEIGKNLKDSSLTLTKQLPIIIGLLALVAIAYLVTTGKNIFKRS